VVLDEGAVWSCHLRTGGLRLTCREGVLWLTHEGDPEDTVVEAGSSVRLDGPGLVVVQALRRARFGPSEP
jgi:ferric-dicitrate binding protein FerR (iron transport regulator)